MHNQIIHAGASRAKAITAQQPHAGTAFARRSATLSLSELRRIVADILG